MTDGFFLHIEPDVILIGDVIMINDCLVLTEMKGIRLEMDLWKTEIFKFPRAFLPVDVKYAVKMSIKVLVQFLM